MKKHAKKIALISAVVVLFAAILTVSLIFGLSSCNQSMIITAENTATVRKKAPVDGSTPEDYSGLDNIAYIAYVLDNQPYYHAYAHNSSRSTGYEQITQTWKDYKSAELSGKNASIMICSDLSYSALVKSASQACFVGNGTAYTRTGDKPARDSVPTGISWSASQPTYYDKESYLNTYGEFSTELSVYAINPTTVESFGGVVNNGDGTYSQTFTLKSEAACWYQFGMKTRGSLKSVPEFEKIEITFTFDSEWQVLSSYCEERMWIAPGALGGITMSSTSKTTTTFYYGESDFDNVHYSYFDSFFNKYVGTIIENKPSGNNQIEILDVLAGGFGQVLTEQGQQFNLELSLGGTDYDGKVYLKLAELSVDAVEARLALEKSGSGKQDFYLEYGNGVANAYFSDAFAVTADINKVSSSVKAFSAWINSLVSGGEDALTVQSESGDIDLASLLNSLELTVGDDTVAISLKSDNLLDFGVGVDLELLFDYSKGEDGNSYSFKSFKLNALSLNSTDINLSVGITPDGGDEIISREASDNPADIAEFIDGVLALAKSEVYEVNISLDGSCEGIEYINGLILNASARVKPLNNFTAFTANVPVTVIYGGLSVSLTADYSVNLNGGDYGDVYLTLNSINGNQYDAKVKCNVSEIVEAVKQLICEFTSKDEVSAQAEEEQAGLNIANVINTVLSLDFASVIKEIKADGSEISLSLNVDEVLSALGVNLGINLGELDFSLGLNEGKAALKGGLPALGANISLNGASGELPEVNPEEYTDLTAFVSGVHKLIASDTYGIEIVLDGTCESIEYLNGASTQLTVLVKRDAQFENFEVYVPAFTVNYKGLTVTLSAYYTFNTKDLSNGNYGDVYLTLSEIGGQSVDVKVHCNIKDTLNAVTELIKSFSSNEETAQGGARAVSGVLDTVLGLDYGAILTEISANGDSIRLGVNADALLTAFDVNLGVDVGTINLTLALDGGTATLNGSVPNFGLTLSVGASNQSIPELNAGVYADAVSYINGVNGLLASETYSVSINLDGTCESLEYIKGVTASATVFVKTENFGKFEVYVPAMSASYQGLNVVLDIYYTVEINGGYGTVYLYVTEIGGQSVDVKVYCNVNEIISAVKQIIDMYSGEAVTLSAQSDKIANVIDTVVSIDYKAVINSFTADNSGINLSINADELLALLNVNGLQAGDVSVNVNLGSDNRLLLGAKAEQLGLALSLSGSEQAIPELDFSAYLDLTLYVNGVYNLLNSKTYSVNIGFTGSQFSVYPVDLEVQIPAQVKLSKDFKDITVNAPVEVIYDGLTVRATLYYTVNLDNGYGDIYVTLNSINENAFNAKVYCNIDSIIESVKQLIALFAPSANSAGETTAEIIASAVSLDFKAIINELTADNTGVNLSVSADAILGALNVDLNGVTIGDVNLTLATDVNKCATLTGSIPDLGISLNLSGNNSDLPAFDNSGYLDLNELVILVTEAVKEVQAIIEQQNAVFSLDVALTVDGVQMRAVGNGQVDWNGGMIRVAVEAGLTISEGEQSETLQLKLVYDEANGENAPLVRFAVNELGLEIYRRDIEGVKGGISDIMNVVGSISGAFSENAVSALSEEEESGNNLTAVIGKVFEEIGKVTVSLISAEGSESKQLVVTYAQNAVLTLGADGGLSLKLDVKNDNATDIININNACISAGGETDKFAEINEKFENGYKFYSASEEYEFTKAVYDYVFAVLNDLTVKNLLGSDTYTVTLVLDGNNSGIEALKDVYVNAGIYYTELADSKLIEAELEISVGGIQISANAYYYNDTVYISVNEINGTVLSNTEETEGLKLRASTEDIYCTADAVVRLVTNKNLIPLINNFVSPAEENGEVMQLSDEQSNTLTGIINALLTLEVKFGKEDGLNTLVLNADAMLEELGLGFKLGTVTVKVNPETHSISASAVNGENSWLDLSAEAVKAENTVHGSAPVAEDYIDIGFVKTLIGDIDTTLGSLGTRTEIVDGEEVTKPDVRISLTGESITVGVSYSVISTSINIKNIVLTAGLDENDKFYFTFTGDLQKTTFTIFTVAKAMPISVTYSNGYITMGRTDDNGNKIYKVMTIEYLLDNLLDKEDSPVRWMLGTDSTPWGLICDNVSLNVNSGLTDIDEYYLYEHTVQTPDNTEDEKAEFILSTLLNGMGIKAGNVESTFGNGASTVTSQLGLTENYYAFDLNLSSLLGNTFSKIYASIVRNSDGGLKGIKAYAAISSGGSDVVKITANLDGGIITAENESAKHAPDYFKIVTASNPGIKFGYDDGTKKFGCYSTENNSYGYSEYNEDYVLNVYDFGSADYFDCPVNEKATVLNAKHSNVTLKSGSTVYMLEEETWLDEEHTLKLIYVDEDGNDLGLSFRIKADTDIFMMIVGESKVHFYDKDGNACNVEGSSDNSLVLYAGDTLPDPQNITVDKDGVSYTFAGWYTESDGKLVNSVQTGIDEYIAKYVLTKVTQSNGVTYSFTRNSEERGGGHYVVERFSSSDITDGVDYSDDRNTLVLANEIDGCKVIAINAKALASSNGYCLKNVVIPYNITSIGASAFLDNYGMKSAVFLADKVTMDGSVSGKNFPFYGCSTASGGKTTELNVYYNAVSPETQWNHFRDGNNYISVGSAGGSLNAAGTWGYVKFIVSYDMIDYGYSDGLVTSPINESYLDGIKANVVSELNAGSAGEGLIYKYKVDVTDNVIEGVHCITVTITEDVSNAWNRLVIEGSDIQIEMTSSIEKVNGEYFVRPGATVTVKPVSGNEGLTRLSVYGDMNKTNAVYDSGNVAVTASLTFAMPDKFAYVSAECAHLPITEVTLRSAVFVEGFIGNDGVYEQSYAINEGEALTYVISADGYTFLGWAFENSSHCLEFEATVQHRVYYAVWSVNREEVSNVSLTNGAFTADVVADKAHSIYGWYAYKTVNGTAVFDNAVTADTLTALTTLVYPRMVFTFDYTMSSSLSGTNYYYVNSDNSDSSANKTGASYSSSFNILEATELYYRWAPDSKDAPDTNNVLQIEYFNEEGTKCTLYFRIKNKGTGWFASTGTKPFVLSGAFTNSEVPVEAKVFNTITVSKNLALDFKAS